MRIWNCTDLNNITFNYEYIPYQNPTMVHNAYFNGDKIFISHYGAGVVVLDASNLPAAPTLLGYYDTYPAPPSQDYFKGAWNVYCYYPSGKFVVSDMQTGLYVFRLGNTIGIQKVGTEIPKEFKLEQNYPNPFNPSTNLEFRIANFGFVTLKVFDIQGKVITAIVNEELKPGIYKVNFDGSKLASGVFFYTLAAEDNINNRRFAESKKMILVK